MPYCKHCGKAFSVPKYNIEIIYFLYCKFCIKLQRLKLGKLRNDNLELTKKDRGLSL